MRQMCVSDSSMGVVYRGREVLLCLARGHVYRGPEVLFWLGVGGEYY